MKQVEPFATYQLEYVASWLIMVFIFFDILFDLLDVFNPDTQICDIRLRQMIPDDT